MEYSLLKSCLGLQKISCALRTTPPDILLPVIHSFDEFMFHCINDLVGGALSLWSHLKATLPPRLGGIGIRLASAHSGAIFLASTQACSALVLSLSNQEIPPSYVSSAIASFTSFTGLSNVTSLSDLPQPVTQKSLSRLVDDFAFNHLLYTSSEVRSRALLLSTSISHAGGWLSVIPSSNLGLHFLDSEFRLCLRYWLGFPLSSGSVACPVCSRPFDPFGDHSLACGGNNDRILRHNAIRDIISTAAQSAALSPRREVPSLIPGSLSHPADVYLPHWSQGHPAALDVTVISHLQQQTLSQAACDRGSALLVAEARKRTLHHEGCRAAGVLAVETLGGWSRDASLTITAICRHLSNRLGLSAHQVSLHLLQRLGHPLAFQCQYVA